MATSNTIIRLIACLSEQLHLRSEVATATLALRPRNRQQRRFRKFNAVYPLLWIMSAGLLLLTACGGSASTSTGGGGLGVDTITMTFTVCIDGRDELIVQGNTLKWQYLDFEPVGASSNCPDNTTLISTALNGTPVMNSVPWLPLYPTTPIFSGELTLPFTSLSPGLPSSPMTATLTVLQARDSLTMTEFPSSANGGTMILDFNDDPSPGAAIYSGKVTIIIPHQASTSN